MEFVHWVKSVTALEKNDFWTCLSLLWSTCCAWQRAAGQTDKCVLSWTSFLFLSEAAGVNIHQRGNQQSYLQFITLCRVLPPASVQLLYQRVTQSVSRRNEEAVSYPSYSWDSSGSLVSAVPSSWQLWFGLSKSDQQKRGYIKELEGVDGWWSSQFWSPGSPPLFLLCSEPNYSKKQAVNFRTSWLYVAFSPLRISRTTLVSVVSRFDDDDDDDGFMGQTAVTGVKTIKEGLQSSEGNYIPRLTGGGWLVKKSFIQAFVIGEGGECKVSWLVIRTSRLIVLNKSKIILK